MVLCNKKVTSIYKKKRHFGSIKWKMQKMNLTNFITYSNTTIEQFSWRIFGNAPARLVSERPEVGN